MSKKRSGGDKEAGDKKVANPAEIDTGDLLKALRATHEEPQVSQLAADAAAFVSAFAEEGGIEEAELETAAKTEPEIEGESDTESETELTAEELTETASQAFEELNETALPATEGAELAEIAEPVEVDELARDLADAEAKSVMESVIFASHNPVTSASLKNLFVGTNIDSEKVSQLLTSLQTDYAGGERGLELVEVAGGYQLRTKLENAPWLKRMIKGRVFKLSGPALEVLSIVAYKQPVIKSEIDQIRGVESSHLLRALMEKHLVRFAGKSELPGKPMLYGTTKEFLELFGLRNIRELPTLSEIDELIPEGIGEISEIEDGETLGTLAGKLGLPQGKSYSESENELLGISDDLASISTSTEFFEQEKIRERDRRDQERAQDLRERKIMGEELAPVDVKWLARFDQKIEALAAAATVSVTASAETENAVAMEVVEEAPLESQSETQSQEFVPELE